MGTLRNSVRHRLSNNKKVLLLVLNETLVTLDLCLSIAGVTFWQGLLIYFSEMLELGSTLSRFAPPMRQNGACYK